MRENHDELEFDGTLNEAGTEYAEFRIDETVAGRYEVVEYLGGGSMSHVWKALDHETDPPLPVALKVLAPALAGSSSGMASLEREAFISLKLTHPNICRLYTFHLRGRPKFLVMEHVNGRTLKEVLEGYLGEGMPWEVLEPIACQVAEALDYAHTATYTDAKGRQIKGVLHRDIKPQNIMVTSEGEVKLMDFGIAREIQNTETQIGGHPSKTPPYASPEQFCGKPMTAASDIYSLAAVLYECLTGRQYVLPDGDMEDQILRRPFTAVGDLPAGVNEALSQGLARDPEARPPNAVVLVGSLAIAMAGGAADEDHGWAPVGFPGAADGEESEQAERDSERLTAEPEKGRPPSDHSGTGVKIDPDSVAAGALVSGDSGKGKPGGPQVRTKRRRTSKSAVGRLPRRTPRRTRHRLLGAFLLLTSVVGGVLAYDFMDLGYVAAAAVLAVLAQLACRNFALSLLVSLLGMSACAVARGVVHEQFLTVDVLVVPIGVLGAVPAAIVASLQRSQERMRRRGR